MSTLLPDCMMPDGADPCAAFTQQIEEIERLRTENENLRRWKALDKPLTAAMGIAQATNNQLRAEIEQLRVALRSVRGYIKDCDHEPAIDTIDAALGDEAPS